MVLINHLSSKATSFPEIMAGYREKFIKTINKGAGIIPHRFLQRLLHQPLILPMYHTITNEHLPHIQHLYPVKNVKKFNQDLDFLLKHYQPIDINTFQSYATGNKPLNQPSFLLTFDDGLREFHDVIAPILTQKGIPAVCFLNSDFVDNQDLFYRYKVSLIIHELHKKPDLKNLVSSALGNSKNLNSKLLTLSHDQLELIHQIADMIGLDIESYLQNEKPYLTTDQINTLIQQGFYFGAHSIDHPKFHDISLDEQIRQTKQSVQYVQDRFNLRYRLFAFPFTDYQVSREFFKYINDNDLVDFTFGCAGHKHDIIKNNYQRIPFEVATVPGKNITNAEFLYYLIKAPFGKNTVKRK